MRETVASLRWETPVDNDMGSGTPTPNAHIYSHFRAPYRVRPGYGKPIVISYIPVEQRAHVPHENSPTVARERSAGLAVTPLRSAYVSAASHASPVAYSPRT